MRQPHRRLDMIDDMYETGRKFAAIKYLVLGLCFALFVVYGMVVG